MAFVELEINSEYAVIFTGLKYYGFKLFIGQCPAVFSASVADSSPASIDIAGTFP